MNEGSKRQVREVFCSSLVLRVEKGMGNHKEVNFGST